MGTVRYEPKKENVNRLKTFLKKEGKDEKGKDILRDNKR